MKIHEYQAVELFREYGINTAPGECAQTSEEAADIAQRIGPKIVVKAQVLVGGRGKAGGIKLANSPQEAKQFAEKILSMQIKSIPVEKVLISKAIDIEKEYYLGITIDRSSRRIVFIGSSAGGVEIEELAKNEPGKINKMYVELPNMLDRNEVEKLAKMLSEDESISSGLCDTFLKMYELFLEKDCSLVEINPFVKTAKNELLAVDAKINFDDNAIFKHSDIEKLKNLEEYTQDEVLAKKSGLSFVSMDGDIGCIVNGAGLAMATMDVIKLFGGKPANFLDVGGSSSPEKVLNALEIVLSNKKVKTILINIFGGITRGDDIAKGILMAKEKLDIKVPLIIRLIGTNEKEGRDILKKAGITVADEMTDAVKKCVGAVREPPN